MIKVYVLRHPVLGYLCGTRANRYYSPNFQSARKWNRRCDASNSARQTDPYWKVFECEIIGVQFGIIETKY